MNAFANLTVKQITSGQKYGGNVIDTFMIRVTTGHPRIGFNTTLPD